MADCVDVNKALEENLGTLRHVAERLHQLSTVLRRVGLNEVAEECGVYAGDIAIARKAISDAWGGYLHSGVQADMAELKSIAGAVLGIKDEP